MIRQNQDTTKHLRSKLICLKLQKQLNKTAVFDVFPLPSSTSRNNLRSALYKMAIHSHSTTLTYKNWQETED